MNGTPRLRTGAWPNTPQTINRRTNAIAAASPPAGSGGRKLPDISTLKKTPQLSSSSPPPSSSEPLIPLDVVDAATQRLVVVAVYVGLWFWRLYNFFNLLRSGENESLWLFMKWIFIDSTFLFGLPALHIPWLEFSSPSITVIFFAHVVFNGCLMFQIGLPVRAWMWGLVKLLYDRETGISERKVKPADILRDDELLSGRHIVHILPEGSAYLNPTRESFCIGGGIASIELPIQINQTVPVSMELLRQDLDTQDTDILSFSGSTLRKARKSALQNSKNHSPSEPLILRFPVKKTGLYTIRSIIDESKLEVRPKKSEAIVVQCPQARVLPTNPNKCRGDLSDVGFEVIGTPPLRVKYRKVVGSNVIESSFQSIQPDDFVSPFARQQQALIRQDELTDASWARARRIVVPVNETLTTSGAYWYAVDQVQDAMGNTVSYEAQLDEYEMRGKGKVPQSQQIFTVHERPIVSLRGHGERPSGCDTQHPLRVAKGEKEVLPVKFSSYSGTPIVDTAHTVVYQFTPSDAVHSDGEHNVEAMTIKSFDFKNPDDRLLIGESGLYSLVGVSTPFCAGEVREPASCMLQNPPMPEVEFGVQQIKDKCQENPVGLRISLSLVGSPPFTLDYTVSKKGTRGVEHKTFKVNGLRGQLDLQPPDAGDYTYKFSQISDRYYKAISLPTDNDNGKFEQSVKPAASAHFMVKSLGEPLCLNERASFPVRLVGDGPWNLKYEIVLPGGRRIKRQEENIEDENFTIETHPLDVGGDYTVSITSVQAGGCEEDLKEEVSFSVRYQKPRAGFGPVDGKRTVHTLENKKIGLPIRLTGERPWSVQLKDGNGHTATHVLTSENSKIEAVSRGTYEILNIRDRHCPGEVDEEGRKFSVDWIERPAVRIVEDPRIKEEGKKIIREAVCEGYEDSVEVVFSGNAPYDLVYEEHNNPDQGAKFMRKKTIHAALSSATIQLETSKAGLYEYRLTELSDQNYDHDPRSFSPITLQQRVHPRPSAKFTHPGKTYNFCSSSQDSRDELIPITLTGVPPFNVEVEVKNLGSARPNVLTFDNIQSNAYNLKIQHKYLRDGNSHISIRSVRDARGCESRRPESTYTNPRVQVAMHDAPSITSAETRNDYCVGEYVSFRLSGSPPFEIFYTFKGKPRTTTTHSHTFRRIIDEPGAFTIDAITDSASDCKSKVTNVAKMFHPKPRGSVSQGKDTRRDIHEGGEDELVFDFVGTPPFEFSYVRRSNAGGRKGGQVLETKTESTEERSVRRKVSAEGEYELVSLKDRYCLTTKQRGGSGGAKEGQKLLTNR
ncbi:uncharacterized protein PV09_07644 [Verruconis gallopava]|uniref:Nucleoporin POM152 n=1 Tax=Verruconis gallopava TaxID=253628 RepID=A0A0D1YJ32_9PEZI|nr:uncharacterized protein PV09_07644 [Verruconis gallopava]KIW00892.1 hypothetical protein PV09_07644 [Verruconis gallopava]